MVEGAETEEAGMECHPNGGEGTGGTDHIHILCCNQRPAVPGVQDPDKIIICNDVKNIVVSWMAKMTMPSESASRPLVGFGVLNDNLIKCLISFVEVHEQILSNRYKGIHGYITQSTIMIQIELCDQCV
jgi:hypothetical protein